MFNFKKILSILALLIISTGAYASNEGVYKVEIVAFTQHKYANASEKWLDAWQPISENIDDLLVSKTKVLAINSAPFFENYLNTNLRRVGSGSNSFYNLNKQLERKSRRILLHKPFILKIDSRPTTLVFESDKRKDGIAEFLGSFSISVGRYFHFQAKTILNNFDNIKNPTGAYASSLLFETRKMRSGELHYLDNPFFGIIVRIDKIEN